MPEGVGVARVGFWMRNFSSSGEVSLSICTSGEVSRLWTCLFLLAEAELRSRKRPAARFLLPPGGGCIFPGSILILFDSSGRLIGVDTLWTTSTPGMYKTVFPSGERRYISC